MGSTLPLLGIEGVAVTSAGASEAPLPREMIGRENGPKAGRVLPVSSSSGGFLRRMASRKRPLPRLAKAKTQEVKIFLVDVCALSSDVKMLTNIPSSRIKGSPKSPP
ncbi:hypothetical protein NDU88_007262 [Pleurodeles waltl]|uniref:Uncharacterized protein n=1 Tax=Pleurodeles waltl TaxID=8319 RepID=A0AAV7RSF9_PLEWA|nr:hypothetical protein NDU88_007262 [Pleurodeles waltl]